MPRTVPAHTGVRVVLWCGFAIYAVVAALLLFTGGPPGHVGSGLNLVPFATIEMTFAHGGAHMSTLLVSNLLVLMPLGVALALWRRIRQGGVAILFIAMTSVTIETLQYVLPGARSTDIDDVIVNSAGGAVAYAVAAGVMRLHRRHTDDELED